MIVKTQTNAPVTVSGDSIERKKFAIAGGGMLGLTLAMRMAKQGHDVTLIEAAPTLGGLASVWKIGDIEFDRHYHVTLLSDSRLRNLVDEIGLADEMNWVETKTGFYTDDELYSMSDTAEFLKFPPLKLMEKLRLGGTIFYASKIRNWKRLEKMPVADWLRRWSGKGTFEKIWLPLLRAKLGESYKKTSAAFIWAHINRMYKARRTGLKKEMFGYVRGGYRTIIHRLIQKLDELGVTVKTSHPIASVAKQANGLFEIGYSNDQPSEHFDKVIMTTPNSILSRVCNDLSADEKARFDKVEYLGIVCASLLLKKPLSKYYVTNITDTWVPMTAVIEMTTIVDPEELGGHSLVYLPKYVPAEHELFDKSDEEIQADFLAALDRMYPHFDREDVIDFKISRVRSVMAIPTLNYSELLPPMKSSVDGLYIVNSSYILKGNLNVNESITIAEEAMETVLKDELVGQ
ncbi:MAG: NAD(P)/FAD-dependent oxidoreductase [Planctomycetota bacterium]